ncbi:MAG: class I SAM-dependent methyltransferase [Betaproteobacteria bacterium]|nr:class I SAM-dependent methyltransferase [Betaproteobacteria bacterium]
MNKPLIEDELSLLTAWIDPASHPSIIELGCGAAHLSRKLLLSHPGCAVTALEVDERQAGAQAIPLADASFDAAIMLKSLHHVPLDLMDQALAQVHRVLRPGGLLYVSEPVFAGPLNEVMRLFHDEELVRAAAIAALSRAVASGAWDQVVEQHFEMPVHYRDFAEFEQRMIAVTFVDHRLDSQTLAKVRERFEPHMTPTGAYFMRPMRANLLCRQG